MSGLILTAGDLRRNVDAYLQQRLPVALEAMSRWLTDDTATPPKPFPMEPPRTWQRLVDFERMDTRQSPAVVTTTPSISPGRRDADGDYQARGLVRVYTVVRGRDYEETADRVAAYITAVRLTLLDQPAAVGADQVTWVEEAYTELAAAADRTIGAGSVTVAYDFGTYGPLKNLPPDLLPTGSRGPTAATTHVDVELMEGP